MKKKNICSYRELYTGAPGGTVAPAPALKMSEKALEQYLVTRAKKNGWLTYKFVSPAQRGVPDRILIGPSGVVRFVELKNPNGKGQLSKLQEVVIASMQSMGADVRVAQSKEEVDACFA